MILDPQREAERLTRVVAQLKSLRWGQLQGWIFQAPGGTAHDLSAADLQMLDVIEAKQLFRVDHPFPRSAVCVAVRGPDGQWLAVSRRNDTTRWGLPGGKVDPGETNLESAVRESFEELGWKFEPNKLEPLYSGLCPGKGPDDTYWVTTYLYRGDSISLSWRKPEEGLALAWMSRESLCDRSCSPFADYNVSAFAAYDQYRPR